tara:strand:+ start:1168 stop:2166 length:999 start_codon:yes stop_codon:yes gene_type:complete
MIRLLTIGCLLSLTTFVSSPSVNAEETLTEDDCLLQAIRSARSSMTVADIRAKCRPKEIDGIKLGAISSRIVAERQKEFDPYVITPHHMNYILPISVTDGINTEAYQDFGGWSDSLEDMEAKFQVSLKVPLLADDLFRKGDALYFGFTLQSWWQIYSHDISKPFRETNYKPEIFYMTPLDWHPGGGNTGLVVGVEHQSNGRGQILSRSWNRVYLNFLYEKDNWAFYFKPWYRLKEDERVPGTDSGDDNPDILDYMGHFEIGTVYEWEDLEFTLSGRQNFAEHHGALNFGMTFPLWGRLRGYVQYSTGYGESLIDYDHNQQRLGLGFALTNAL